MAEHLAETPWRAVPGTTWRDRAPAMLRDTLTGPRSEPCFAPTDRRWLWRLESFLAVYGTNQRHDDARRDLLEYLRETCEHHWEDYAAESDGSIPAHRQCLWCNDVDWLGNEPKVAD